MNFDKKRKRQRGRQDAASESERELIYRQGYFDGKHSFIERFIEAGIFPPITFGLNHVSQEEFKKDYPSEI